MEESDAGEREEAEWGGRGPERTLPAAAAAAAAADLQLQREQDPCLSLVSTAALFPRRKGRTDFLDFGAHIIGFKVPPFTHLGTVTCQSLLGMAILPRVRLADRWVKVRV